MHHIYSKIHFTSVLPENLNTQFFLYNSNNDQLISTSPFT